MRPACGTLSPAIAGIFAENRRPAIPFLRLPNLAWGSLHAGHLVSSSPDAPRPIAKFVIVHRRMVRCDKHKIKRRYCRAVPFDGFSSGELWVFAGWFNHWNVRIVIGYIGASFCQQLHQCVTGRFALVIDIRLISQTYNQNPGTFDGLALGVESVRDHAHDVLGHSRIDLASQFNETRMLPIFASLPREIKRIDGDAVSTKPRAGIERHEAERLRFSCLDHFPDIDAPRAVNQL